MPGPQSSESFAVRALVPAALRVGRVVLVAALVAGLPGCPKIEEGYFSCSQDSECPTDWFCRSDCRCYETADPEGGAPMCTADAASVDAASIDDASADAGS